MAIFENSSFQSDRIHIDGHSYKNCKFKGCEIIYSGGDLPSVVGCEFHETKWTMDGAAARTLLMLKSVYHGMGDGGKTLIEDTFNNIRGEK